MDAGAVEKYLHEHIPLSKAMGVEVLESSMEGVKLSAPLPPNINHRGTVFGGSAASVAILSAWALLYLRLKNECLSGNLVIQKNTMTYVCPITGRFTATSALHDPAAWNRFTAMLRKRNRARIHVSSILHCNDKKVGELHGDFVAMGL
jgi:thioesterase domain-containing protein